MSSRYDGTLVRCTTKEGSTLSSGPCHTHSLPTSLLHKKKKLTEMSFETNSRQGLSAGEQDHFGCQIIRAQHATVTTSAATLRSHKKPSSQLENL